VKTIDLVIAALMASAMLSFTIWFNPPTIEGNVASDVHMSDDRDGKWSLVIGGPPYWTGPILSDADITIDGAKARPVDLKRGMKIKAWENGKKDKGDVYKVRAERDKRFIPRDLTPIEVQQIKARFGEPPMYLKDGRWYGPPGAFLNRESTDASHWLLCCPGCGEAGAPRTGATWRITAGSFEDVSTLTLEPSIATNCRACPGWHGYLRNGIFGL
jgi:hypothetical protein